MDNRDKQLFDSLKKGDITQEQYIQAMDNSENDLMVSTMNFFWLLIIKKH